MNRNWWVYVQILEPALQHLWKSIIRDLSFKFYFCNSQLFSSPIQITQIKCCKVGREFMEQRSVALSSNPICFAISQTMAVFLVFFFFFFKMLSAASTSQVTFFKEHLFFFFSFILYKELHLFLKLFVIFTSFFQWCFFSMKPVCIKKERVLCESKVDLPYSVSGLYVIYKKWNSVGNSKWAVGNNHF